MGQHKALEIGPAPGQYGKEKGHLDTPLSPPVSPTGVRTHAPAAYPAPKPPQETHTHALPSVFATGLDTAGLGMSLRPGGISGEGGGQSKIQ